MEPSSDANQQPGSRLIPIGSTEYNAGSSSSRSRDAHSTSEQSTPPVRQGHNSNPKVAIPRNRAAASVRYSRRVAKACESCRQRKTKCSGDTPVCRQCRELRVKCLYPDGMREKTKRHMEELSSKAKDYESLLKELRSSVDDVLASRISMTLAKYSADEERKATDPPSSSSRTPLDDADLEPSSPSSVGSLEAIDRVEEDLNRGENARATGYIGKNSEISWMQRAQREAVQRAQKEPGMYEGEPQERQYEEFSINAVSYHLDDLDISVPGPVDMYGMPSRGHAERLFEDYLSTAHPFFPIINRPLFTSQFKYFFDNSARPNDRWLAILNMIFAIAAKHAHLAQVSWKGDDADDHLLYFTRARYLSMTGDDLFIHPDLQQVQLEGLMAFYLLSTDQINRAWRISSLAIRSAIALGINMKSSSETTTNISKESRYRVWWSLYSFEHLLGVMTGRATCILDGVCTTPMPIPFEEEKFNDPEVQQLLSNPSLREERVQSAVASYLIRLMPLNPIDGKESDESDRLEKKIGRSAWIRSIPFNTGLLFLLYIDLTAIAQEIENKVYTSDAVSVPWTHIENRIGDLKARIDLWFKQLPDPFRFTDKDSSSPEQVRAKLGLAFHYYSARITLGRPCLCRRDASSNNSHSFSHKMALVSLEAATRMLDLIPDPPDPSRLYQLAPWWTILHYLMQATTVLLLELSFANVHAPEEETHNFHSAKKAIRWLYAMSEHSTASYRAWQLCDSCMRRIAVGLNYDVSDLPFSPNAAALQQQKGSQERQQQLVNAVGMTGDIPRATIATHHHHHHPSTAVEPDSIAWNTGMESLPPSDAAMPREVLSDLELQQAAGVTAAELVTSYPMSFPPFMMDFGGGGGGGGGGTSGPSTTDSHFPYDPITGQFMGSFFPNPGDDQQNWDT